MKTTCKITYHFLVRRLFTSFSQFSKYRPKILISGVFFISQKIQSVGNDFRTVLAVHKDSFLRNDSFWRETGEKYPEKRTIGDDWIPCQLDVIVCTESMLYDLKCAYIRYEYARKFKICRNSFHFHGVWSDFAFGDSPCRFDTTNVLPIISSCAFQVNAREYCYSLLFEVEYHYHWVTTPPRIERTRNRRRNSCVENVKYDFKMITHHRCYLMECNKLYGHAFFVMYLNITMCSA